MIQTFRQWVASLPIRVKLMVLASFASGTALLLAGGILSVAEYRSDQQRLVQRLQTQADITARNTAAALAFDDAEAATLTVQALAADQAIMAAEVLRLDGTKLAQYQRSSRALPRDRCACHGADRARRSYRHAESLGNAR